MNNILFVNPRGGVITLLPEINKEKVKCYAVITNDKRNFLTDEQSKNFEIYSTVTLPADITFVTSISSDVFGFKFQEQLVKEDRITFTNDKTLSGARLNSFLVGAPTVDYAICLESFSFSGKHVVSSAWEVLKTGYTLINPTTISNWDSLVDSAFGGLEKFGYQNGPSQVFFDKDFKLLGFKYQSVDWMNASFGTELVGRYWMTQFPAIVEDPNNNDKGYFKRFYEWSRTIGDNRTYTMLKPYTKTFSKPQEISVITKASITSE